MIDQVVKREEELEKIVMADETRGVDIQLGFAAMPVAR